MSNDGQISKDGKLPAHGPRNEGVDPLTTGQTTYGEDVKGASTHDFSGVDDSTEREEQVADDQPSDGKPKKAAKKSSK